MSDDDDTTTLTEPKPLAGDTASPPSEDPAAEAALQPPPDGAETKPGDAPAPSDGDEGETKEPETPPPPAWATLTDPDEVLAHETLAPRIAEREDAALEKGRTEALETMREANQAREERLNAIDGKLGRFVGEFNKLSRLGPEGERPLITKEALGDLMEEYRDMFAAITGEGQDLGKWSGAAGLVNELAKAVKSEDFGEKFRTRLTKMQRGLTDPTLFTDMATAISVEAKKPLQEEIKELTAKVERLEVEAKTAERNGTKPPAEPAGKGGGGTMTRAEEDAILLDPESDLKLVKEIRARR
jgi:hypothetical protein